MNNGILFGLVGAVVAATATLPVRAQSHQLLESARTGQIAGQKTAYAKVPNKPEKVTWFMAPLRLQIVDNRPIVTDTRTPDEVAESFNIPVAPLGCTNGFSGSGAVPTLAGGIPVPGTGPAFRTGLPMVPGMASLPKSKFDTNIPASGSAVQRRLPNANSTNLLAGKMIPHPHAAGGGASPRHTLINSPGQGATVARYTDSAPSASLSSSQRVDVSVTGKLQGRGDLLSR